MTQSIIYLLIKTECGRAKYNELSSKKGIVSKIRLFWFILIATIRDWNIKNHTKENQGKLWRDCWALRTIRNTTKIVETSPMIVKIKVFNSPRFERISSNLDISPARFPKEQYKNVPGSIASNPITNSLNLILLKP